jgi:hypothetical protein
MNQLRSLLQLSLLRKSSISFISILNYDPKNTKKEAPPFLPIRQKHFLSGRFNRQNTLQDRFGVQVSAQKTVFPI